MCVQSVSVLCASAMCVLCVCHLCGMCAMSVCAMCVLCVCYVRVPFAYLVTSVLILSSCRTPRVCEHAAALKSEACVWARS